MRSGFSPDGKLLATGSWDNTVKLWDVDKGKELKTLIGHSKGVEYLAFSSDGSRLVTGALDRTLIVWDVESGREILTP